MPKGYEAAIAVVPETDGWGTADFKQGHFLNVDSESLTAGQEFKDRPDKIIHGRAERLNSRSKAAQKPAGDIEFQFRSDDVLATLMSHFQKYVGTQFGTNGTSMYTFVPEKGQPDWVGSTWGSGSYTSPSGDMFTVKVIKKLLDNDSGTDNSMIFTNCFADQLVFNLEAGDDAKITASFKSKSLDEGTHLTSAVNPNNTVYGSYSAKTAFESWEGTLDIGGRTDLRVTSIQFTSINNSEDREIIGKLNPDQYDFGRYQLTGVINIDAPKEALDHFGSMINDRTLAVNGTLYNGANDYLIFNMPNCKYEPFDVNIAGANDQTEYGLNFKAFMSNDGLTSPITITVRTDGMDENFGVA